MLRVLMMAAVLFAAPGGMAVASQPQSPGETPIVPESPQGDAAAAPEAPQVPGNVSGIYRCEGTNPDGSPYEGLVEIAAIEDTYLVHWIMANGAQVLGVGIFKGGVLSVSYFGGTPAVAVYRPDGDRLVGEWTMGGAEGMLYSETLTRMPVKPGQPHAAPPQRPAPQPGPEAAPRKTRPVRGVTAV